MRTVIYRTSVLFPDGDLLEVEQETRDHNLIEHAGFYHYDGMKRKVLELFNRWNRGSIMLYKEDPSYLAVYTFLGFGDDRL